MREFLRHLLSRRALAAGFIILVHIVLLRGLAGTDVSAALFSFGEHTSFSLLLTLLALLIVRLYCFMVLPGTLIAASVLAVVRRIIQTRQRGT